MTLDPIALIARGLALRENVKVEIAALPITMQVEPQRILITARSGDDLVFSTLLVPAKCADCGEVTLCINSWLTFKGERVAAAPQLTFEHDDNPEGLGTDWRTKASASKMRAGMQESVWVLAYHVLRGEKTVLTIEQEGIMAAIRKVLNER